MRRPGGGAIELCDVCNPPLDSSIAGLLSHGDHCSNVFLLSVHHPTRSRDLISHRNTLHRTNRTVVQVAAFEGSAAFAWDIVTYGAMAVVVDVAASQFSS